MGLPSNPRGNRPALSRARSQASFHPGSQSHKHGDGGVGVVGLGTLPGPAQLANAARMEVLKENGLPVTFGALWQEKRTIVVFIRHFWCVFQCAMCQDYLASIMRDVDHAEMKRSGVQLIIVGCGSFNLIKSYRHIFHLPYQIFVDPSPGQQLYRALGMACMAPAPVRQRNGKAERGEYVKHGPMGGLAMVWKNALKVGMPVWERGGDAGQLGGEFVLGPGLTCSYAHRMQNARTHAPIAEVLDAAGVPFVLARPGAVTRVRLPRRSNDSGSDFEEIKLPSQVACLEEYGVVIGIAQTDSVDWDSNASGESGVIVHTR
ncbi:hypothetical protein OF83DRAFT_1049944 [Amylostereum chailletii]|nr:hypothetical protein OF83DRAFT_1049944 [Amylostereum chailletii]